MKSVFSGHFNQYRIFQHLKGNQGLSILEVLIASTILAFISIGVVTFTSNSIDTRERTLSEDRDDQLILTAMSRIKNDFQYIYSPLLFDKAKILQGGQNDEPPSPDDVYHSKRFVDTTEKGYPIPIFHNDDKSSFVFLSSNNKRRVQDQKQSQFVWVRYSLMAVSESENDEKSREVLEKREQENAERLEQKKGESKSSSGSFYNLIRETEAADIYGPDEINWEQSKNYVVLEKVISFTIEFWDAKDKKFVGNLQELRENQYTLQAIKVTIEYANKEGVEFTQTNIFRRLWPFFNAEKADADEEKVIKNLPKS